MGPCDGTLEFTIPGPSTGSPASVRFAACPAGLLPLKLRLGSPSQAAVLAAANLFALRVLMPLKLRLDARAEQREEPGKQRSEIPYE